VVRGPQVVDGPKVTSEISDAGNVRVDGLIECIEDVGVISKRELVKGIGVGSDTISEFCESDAAFDSENSLEPAMRGETVKPIEQPRAFDCGPTSEIAKSTDRT